MPSEKSQRPRLLVPACLFLFSLGLNSIGIGWGQPGGVPWNFDSIAGLSSFKEGDFLFGKWRHRYPRAQFLVNNAVYRPLLKVWYRRLDFVPRSEAKIMRDPAHASRFGVLITLSQLISALMGAGAVVASYLASRLLFGDPLAGTLGGLALATTQMLVLCSHLGNVDAAAAFWYAWCQYAAVCILTWGRKRDFLMFGLFAALAVCTKDPLAGFIIGLSVATAFGLAASRRLARGALRAASAGGLLFLAIFAILNDLLIHPQAFIARMTYWIGGPGVTNYNTDFTGYGALAVAVFWDWYRGMGWPMMIFLAAAIAWLAVASPVRCLVAVLPMAAFLVLVIGPIRFSEPHYFLPGFIAASTAMGGFGAAMLRRRGWRRVAAGAAVGLVGLLSLMYCIGLDLEFVQDTRYDVERWFAANARPGSSVAALCPWELAPRLSLLGFRYDWRWARPTTEQVLLREPSYPDYLVLSEKHFTNWAVSDPPFRRRLLAGEMGYELVASFENRYLWPRRTLLGLAGWPAPRPELVSPRVLVLKRKGLES